MGNKESPTGDRIPSRGEITTHRALLRLFPGEVFIREKSFPHCRSTKDYPLRFDFYCESRRLAIEYNGYQHYFYTPHFHPRGLEDFHNQQANDRIKKKYCHRQGITLICVPYLYTTEDEITNYLIKNLPQKSCHLL